MNHPAFLTEHYLDILFLNRNKKYGGYELRKHYTQRASKALLAVVLVTTALALAAYTKEAPGNGLKIENTQGLIVTDVDLAVKLPQPTPPKKIMPPPPDVAIAKHTSFKIKPDEDVLPEEKPIENADLKNKQIGTENREGKDTDADIGGPASNKYGDGEDLRPETPVVPPAPVKWVEQMPAFEGDINKYLQTNLRYPTMARENGISGRVTIQFVVNEDGSISEASIVKGIGGGCNEEALRVINAMPKWKAGRQNGRAVKVYLTLPIIFELQ